MDTINEQSLKTLFQNEIRDLRSVNFQMREKVQEMIDLASREELKSHFREVSERLGSRDIELANILESHGVENSPGTCRGVKEYLEDLDRHGGEQQTGQNERDLVLISQCKRLNNFGLAGYKTAKVYASVLGDGKSQQFFDEAIAHFHKLETSLDNIYQQVTD